MTARHLSGEELDEILAVLKERDKILVARALAENLGDEPMGLPPSLADGVTQAAISSYIIGFLAGISWPDDPFDRDQGTTGQK